VSVSEWVDSRQHIKLYSAIQIGDSGKKN